MSTWGFKAGKVVFIGVVIKTTSRKVNFQIKRVFT